MAAPGLLDLPVKKPRDPLSGKLAKNNRRQQLYLVTALRADQMAKCRNICVSEGGQMQSGVVITFLSPPTISVRNVTECCSTTSSILQSISFLCHKQPAQGTKSPLLRWFFMT